MLDRLGYAKVIGRSRAALDSAGIPAKRGAGAPARTQPTGAKRGASATLSWTATASRSPSGSARPTATTAISSRRGSMPCRRYAAASADRNDDRPSSLADKGHDFPQCRRALRRRAIRPLYRELGQPAGDTQAIPSIPIPRPKCPRGRAAAASRSEAAFPIRRRIVSDLAIPFKKRAPAPYTSAP